MDQQSGIISGTYNVHRHIIIYFPKLTFVRFLGPQAFMSIIFEKHFTQISF